jgi:hypothetical protein
LGTSRHNLGFHDLTTGAGPNFGVVTEFVFKAHAQTNDIWSGVLAYTPDKIPAVLEAFAEYKKDPPSKTMISIAIGCAPGTTQPTIMISPFLNGPDEEGRKIFKGFFDAGPVMEMVGCRPYVEQVR